MKKSGVTPITKSNSEVPIISTWTVRMAQYSLVFSSKSLKSVSCELSHDQALYFPFHFNKQLIVEVQAATMGMTYCWVCKDERSLETCFSKKWRQRHTKVRPVHSESSVFCPYIFFKLNGLLGFWFKCFPESHRFISSLLY